MTGMDTLPLAAILLTGALYARGYATIARRPHRLAGGPHRLAGGPHHEAQGSHRPARRAHGLGAGRAAAFGTGLAVLAIAVASPLAALSHQLFAAHMVQHMLLIAVAPPLLVYGRPAQPLWAAASPPVRRRLHRIGRLPLLRMAARGGRSALVVVALSVTMLWGWHAPAPYQAALRSEVVHAAEHLCLFGTSLLLWRLVLGAPARHHHGQAILSIFVSGLAAAALGAVLTLSTTVLYPAYGAGPRPWDLTPLEDQQLAGSIMWIPPGLLSLGTMVALAHAWLAEAERRSQRRDEARRPAGVEARLGVEARGRR